MQFLVPVEKYMPELQLVLKEFARKSHAVNLLVDVPSLTVGKELLNNQEYTATFIDPRFPNRTDARDRVGSVYWNRSDGAYVIRSRLIKNEKFRKDSHDYYTKTTKDYKKAIKAMLEVLKPFSYNEIFLFNKSQLQDLVGDWRGELYGKGDRLWTSVFADDLYEEVKHLHSMGIQFKTEKFRTLVGHISTREEHLKREKQHLAISHVFIEEGKVVVTTKVGDRHSIGVSTETKDYLSIEALPEDIYGAIAMLKILGGGKEQMVRGVGFRVSDNEFYVMKPIANTTNA
jgi:hypothetical protein